MATAERLAVTVTVTSFETVAEPQVGVDVQTTYQVPAPPRLVAVGVKVDDVAPEIEVIAPPEVDRFPHCLPVIVPPPVSVAVNWEPDPPTHMDCAVPGERLTEERLAETVTVAVVLLAALQAPLVKTAL